MDDLLRKLTVKYQKTTSLNALCKNFTTKNEITGIGRAQTLYYWAIRVYTKITKFFYLQCNNPDQILDLVSDFDSEKMNLTRFTSFTFTTTRFWSIYVVILIGVVSMFCIEVTEMFRDGIRYFKSGANAMDCTNILCSGIFLITTWIDKDTAIWFGATSVLFSWVIFSKGIGDIPIIGNWVYLLGNTVKKIVPFLLVFLPLLFGFGLRFKFMFPTEVCMGHTGPAGP